MIHSAQHSGAATGLLERPRADRVALGTRARGDQPTILRRLRETKLASRYRSPAWCIGSVRQWSVRNGCYPDVWPLLKAGEHESIFKRLRTNRTCRVTARQCNEARARPKRYRPARGAVSLHRDVTKAVNGSLVIGLVGGGSIVVGFVSTPPVLAPFEWMDRPTPWEGAVVVYVDPEGGDNSNDGLTPATPKLTWHGVGGALSLSPDFIYSKQGATYDRIEGGNYGNDGINDKLYCRDGADEDHPFCLLTYSDPADPSDARAVIHDTQIVLGDNCVVDGFLIEKTDWMPDGGFTSYDPEVGFIGPVPPTGYPLAIGIAREVEGGGNIVVQNCKARLTIGSGLSISPGIDPPVTGITLIGFVSELNEDSGIYMGHCKNISLRGCVFEHNGWNAAVRANQFKHNVYLNQSSEPPCEVLDCFTSRPSSYGIQPRAGGDVQRCVVSLSVWSVFNGSQRGPGSLSCNVVDAGINANDGLPDGEYDAGGNGPFIGGGPWITRGAAARVWFNQTMTVDGTPNTGDKDNITTEYRLDGGPWLPTNQLHPAEENAIRPGFYSCDLLASETNGDNFELRSFSTSPGVHTDFNVHMPTRPLGSSGGWPMDVFENILGEDFFGTSPNKGFSLTTDLAELGWRLSNLTMSRNICWNRSQPIYMNASCGPGNVLEDNVSRQVSGYSLVYRDPAVGNWPSPSDFVMRRNRWWSGSEPYWRVNNLILNSTDLAAYLAITEETDGDFTDPDGEYTDSGRCLAQYAVDVLGVASAWGTNEEKMAAMVAAAEVALTRDREAGTGFDTLAYINWRRVGFDMAELVP